MADDLGSSSTSMEHIAAVSTARAGQGKKKTKTIPTHELSPKRSEEGLSGVSGMTEKPAELSVTQLAQIAALGCVSQPLSCVKFVVNCPITTKAFHNPCRALKSLRRCR